MGAGGRIAGAPGIGVACRWILSVVASKFSLGGMDGGPGRSGCGGGIIGGAPIVPRAGPAKPGGGPMTACGTGIEVIGAPSPEGGCLTSSRLIWPGGATALTVMMFSPRRITKPKRRLISRSFRPASAYLALGILTVLYSSQSLSTRFMCLSKAMRVPTK